MNRKGPIEIAFSHDPFDQKRLIKAGGYITHNRKGQVVFRFDTAEQYAKYLMLNEHRGA
ncbi:hypothetical protein CathTA2_2433 [Caldalkalibacillus thermarum TA2.A1]|uniref:Uncharacterized protein n=1 Tax=Caldalkalibacillus thermarum (strain TA2.A1) TaxID=986075 RepID=F5L9C8_CALTT|nr:hypothetical protein [Caldalkalibacillus thermarum]EGL82070.1 hypothetical protein CathTA2_2433 [Caldalkalibacillus thermarum TA2.A1]QZT34013.1 hypothetical protein HUR95_00810 [Caldalkalibacillus thermarum TA2.A1]